MKKNIVNPLLPGRYGRMSAEELAADVERFDREIDESELKPLTKELKRAERLSRRRGRPRIGRGAEKIRVSVERDLLCKSDAFARSHGMSRSEMIARGLRVVMAIEAA